MVLGSSELVVSADGLLASVFLDFNESRILGCVGLALTAVGLVVEPPVLVDSLILVVDGWLGSTTPLGNSLPDLGGDLILTEVVLFALPAATPLLLLVAVGGGDVTAVDAPGSLSLSDIFGFLGSVEVAPGGICLPGDGSFVEGIVAWADLGLINSFNFFLVGSALSALGFSAFLFSLFMDLIISRAILAIHLVSLFSWYVMAF